MYIQIFHLYTILNNVQSSKPIMVFTVPEKYISILTAPSTWLLYWGAFNLKIRFLWTTRSSWSHSLLYFFCHGHEGLLHICGVFGTCFKEGNAKRVSKLLQAKNIVFTMKSIHMFTLNQLNHVENVTINVWGCMHVRQSLY